VEPNAIALAHAAANVGDDPLCIGFAGCIDGRNDHDPLFLAFVNAENGRAAAAQRRDRGLHDRFDVLRIELAAPDDDEIFQPPGDEERVPGDKPEITGAQIGPAAEPRTERLA